ncbi:MAG: prepilin-type N-terminal cleavage/methylation domain-containing protein, partial [Candidatus Omnitrophica bacterium]|nr:prepilin-type N-terminal cleavage/methylation domain-containing protein [Candidatus Omnitrophota bacterium]
MGLTFLKIGVGNPAKPEITEDIEFLVDSGAIYSVVPAKILRKLGIKPLDTQEFRLANGEKIVRKKGIALFRYGKKVGGADVIFGEEGDSTLLGAFTLESLGLTLDPLKRELRPLPMVIAQVKKGVTLIEMLTVIAIIGILAGLI